MRIRLLLAVLAFWGSLNAQAANLRGEMLDQLTTIENVFQTLYAPGIWKKEFSQWELEEQILLVKEQVIKSDQLTVKEYHRLLKQFFLSTKDYHVGYGFYATEKATLPLTIRGSQGRYFIAAIDRNKLSSDSFPFQEGDEVVKFGNHPVQEVVQELRKDFGSNSPLTDQALTEYSLTSRNAARAQKIPRGPIQLTLKKKGSETLSTHQLVWEYTPESIDYDILANSSEEKSWENGPSLLEKIQKYKMLSPLAFQLSEELKDQSPELSPFKIGNKTSFIPSLGEKIWENSADDKFSAYIFMNEERKLIGYIRIPSYGAGVEEAMAFEKIIQRFERVTDALVIDQINNPGGSVFYLYALASMLSQETLNTPRHHLAITPKEVAEAFKEVTQLRKITNDEEAQKYLGAKSVGGYPVSLTLVSFLVEYHQFILDQWKEGKVLTDPYFLWGVDQINPHPKTRYSKPILVLINELDFSGGDFFPAILQDNKRATIMGTRTAGAGGYVLGQEIPNRLGLSNFSVTGSLAKRVDNAPIENLGVTPDISYELTPEDYQNNFKGYAKAIKEALAKILKKN